MKNVENSHNNFFPVLIPEQEAWNYGGNFKIIFYGDNENN